jgi:DNA polymerase III delta prime subunit
VSSPRLQPLISAIGQVLLGKEQAVRLALACLLARGHLLIEDLPGMGKTTLAEALARAFGLEFKRVSFTSDLLPADLTGINVFDAGSARFHFQPGPLFSQVLLADEINRASPRTQSALLEAMAAGRWWGLDLAWSRWWLGFDQAGQEALLQRLFGDQRQWLGAVVLGAVAGLLALALAWLQWLQEPARQDQLRREVQAVVQQLKRNGVEVQPGESFEQLCNRACRLLPATAAELQELARCHNLLRYAELGKQERIQQWTAWRTALRAINKAPKSTL